MNRLEKVIRGRPVAIMLNGASIVELERHIESLAESDICWASLGAFNMMEDFILSKIDKRLDIVFDCATVANAFSESYETQHRLPRITEFLSRGDNNLWVTSTGLMNDSIKKYMPNIVTKYGRKIDRIDKYFPEKRIGEFMNVPNSATLLLASALIGGASKIIFFGLDGYVKAEPCPSGSCYHPELIEIERKAALGKTYDPGINRDTVYFQKRLPKIVRKYREEFDNWAKIYNCSPRTVYDIIRKITYSDLKDIL